VIQNQSIVDSLVQQGINGKMSITPKEWHAFLIGWGHGACPKFCTIFPISMGEDNPLVGEYHYYIIGRAIGFFTMFSVVIGGLTWLLQLTK
jgi:hypothetical protein